MSHDVSHDMSHDLFSVPNTFVSTMRTAPTRKVVPIPGASTRVQRERGTKVRTGDQ